MRQTLPSDGEHLHVGDGAAIDVAALVLGEGAAVDVAAFVLPGESAAVNGTADLFGESEFHFGCWWVCVVGDLEVC